MLPSPPASHDGRMQGNPVRPKPIRRDPEKRRQQNIQAQRKYREKLKQRLDELQRLEASKGNDEASFVIVKPNDLSNASLVSKENVLDPLPDSQCSCQRGASSIEGDTTEVMFGSNDLTTFSTDLSLLNQIAFDDNQICHDTSVPSELANYIDCGCLKPHLEIITVAGSREYRDTRRIEDGLPQFRFDLYGNSLRIERLCIMQAVMANCEHIGITEEMVCDENATSPFFRPVSGAIDDAANSNIVKKVQSIFAILKPDVRPIEEQITSRHHPVIDALPFPTFRKNLITYQQTIDEDQLFDDLVNGLVCWGGTGISRKNQNMSAGEVTSGTPWDSRSWEGKTWFLQKYWTILGGEDGELVRQSEWWRNMRGDDSEVWPVNRP